MRILTVHNKYKIRGGEDESRESEDRLLESRGHEIRHIIFNNEIIGSPIERVHAGLRASWSIEAYRSVSKEIREWKPDILDVHNFFPLASPAVHYAGRRAGVPVVQTLHNFRLLCPGATFYREGRVCEDCTKYPVPLPGILHGCYHGSPIHTAGVAGMIATHRVLGTWRNAVSLFIAVSAFAKTKFVENGFPESKIYVKPNFAPDGGRPDQGGEEFLFVGRLSPEKGIQTLIRAMDLAPAARLNIVGEGPLELDVRAAAQRNPRICYLGKKPHAEVMAMMGRSRCVVFPSEWYETFGRVAAESFARGTPVIASRIGAVAEIVDHGRTGFQFTPGDAQGLAGAMTQASEDKTGLAEMRIRARREYEAKYTPERNYHMLIAAYEMAIANSQTSCRLTNQEALSPE